MVSFACEACAEVLPKKKLDFHRCRNGFTCLDCNKTFFSTDYQAHTSCVSEDQRYQKSVYRETKKRKRDSSKEIGTKIESSEGPSNSTSTASNGVEATSSLNNEFDQNHLIAQKKPNLETAFHLLKAQLSTKPKKLLKTLKKANLSWTDLENVKICINEEAITLTL